ncbi:RluA family pseudouridine synthase [Treponema sp. Marseille-Q3903]|uniref:RluA family pseudouridine synthase n=1 Tax=Treponema sp. Marseille-Q3903 TaxID=2766703 RepID=UPI0016520CDE|nr:RluA family pseudouridine synthase [Treponema sp. Marseille-Q3903]MBC6713615.1 RluA family pseudouridine synthase [Treponema sp. Marseille-Q3903]
MPFFTAKVPEDYENQERLDKFIASLPNGMNRSKLKSGVNEILLNGKKVKLSQKVKAGDIIDIQWEDNIPDNIEPENIPLDIIYEDDDVTVVNKKQGMVTHPACGNWNKTLVNALLYHWGRKSIEQIKEGCTSDIIQRRRPGIVHRLDKETSGIIITAKNRDAEEFLQKQFKDKSNQKEYILIVTGRPPHRNGDIRTNIIRDPKNRHRFKAVDISDEGKFSRTIYHCIACYGNYSLLRVRIKTGRTHQIRVHMKYLGCPILGDSIYNKPDSLFPDATLMLHSVQLKIKLPGDNQLTTFRTSVPNRFKRVEKKLKEKFPKTVLER